MLNKLVAFLAVASGVAAVGNVGAIIDWKAFEKNAVAVSTYALQGAIDDKSPIEQCAEAAVRDVARVQEKGYKLSKVECVRAGLKDQSGNYTGYKVIVYKADE